jgi:hypothetical protein
MKDGVLRDLILKEHVFCINKYHTCIPLSRKRKTTPEKCTWTGKYDELSSSKSM